jgi:leucine-rich repeat transmembrane neuronal protein 1/2
MYTFLILSYIFQIFISPISVAPIVSYDGNQFIKVKVRKPPHRTHVNDISVRFKTPLEDTVVFCTESPNGDDFMRVLIERGKAKFIVRVNGVEKDFYLGDALNDNEWHTLNLLRRADYVEFWVDRESPLRGFIPAKGFSIDYNNIYFGSCNEKMETPGKWGNYIGQMQNGIFDGFKVFDDLYQTTPSDSKVTVTGTARKGDETLPIVFNAVTFTRGDTYVALPQLNPSKKVRLSFLFKTKSPNGLLAFSGQPGQQLIALELVNGIIHYIFENGGESKVSSIPTPNPLNDDKWHLVSLELPDPLRHILTVDTTVVTINPDQAASGSSGNLVPPGQFYIGGVPSNMYGVMPALINSKNGFEGCFASWYINGRVPNLLDTSLTSGGYITNGCIGKYIFATFNPKLLICSIFNIEKRNIGAKQTNAHTQKAQQVTVDHVRKMICNNILLQNMN